MLVIVSRDRGSAPRAKAFEDAVARLFADRAGASVLIIPHLYHVAEDDPLWAKLAAAAEPVVFLSWLHPRPAEWLLRRHGVGGSGLLTVNMAAHPTPEDCVCGCAAVSTTPTHGTITELDARTAKRWYPVIDDGRCVNCGQCLQFCLFGVYELGPGDRVRVANPDNCKHGCPACSRICPRGAIMFPLYDRDDAIAGAPGKFITPDAEAKAMFKKRTKRTHRDAAAPKDDLDRLIDDLDQLAQRRS